ncbi:MAG: T9SS type A sorting domain-containing protein [Bacteroidales bacterium]|nr:T9SS type A sorting domain-containing protein [Bacteroidales bacterium]
MRCSFLQAIKGLMAMTVLGASLSVSAQITPCKMFQSGMVLQRDVVVPIWGTASANAEITISWNGSEAKSTADADGKWKVEFPATNYGGPFDMTIASSAEDETTVTLKDVYFGEVLYCSGQSNMELRVDQCDDYANVKAAANDQTIRQMKVEKGTAYELSETLPTVSWKPATSANVGNFSAAAYFCVLELKKLDAYKDIPFGILNNSYGGARVEAWMSKEMLGYDAYDITLAQGEAERQPTLIYNKMVHPLIGLPFKAMLWYQAESNCDISADAIVYSEQFNTMITSYRKLWNNEFPVIWVQLPNYKSETRTEVNNVESNSIASDPWISMREEQTKSLSILSKSAQIVTIDAGLAGNIHPTDKQTIGTRLALAVRKLVYGEETAYSPMYKSFTKNDDGSITIEFSNVNDGLVAKDGAETITWFQVVDVAGKSSKVAATLADNKITIAKGEADIAAVYYAWNRCPGGMNLYSKVGEVYLPVAPFMFEVETSEFGIQEFSSTKGVGEVTAEGGNFVTFTWKTGGNVETARFNGVEVDPNTSAKVMLSETKDYVLEIVEKEIGKIDSKTIHFTVVPAKPTIKLSSVSGVLANPTDEVEIAINAAAPGGFSVTKVDLYLGEALLTTLTEAPYSYVWTAPNELGEYVFKGIVYNNNSDDAVSEPLTLVVTDQKKVRFEAEKAVLVDGEGSGSAAITDANCSNGKYMALQDFVTLTFKNIYAPEAGTYPVYIKYMCNYEAPKRQSISVNGVSQGEIEFTSEDWDTYKMTLPLQQGMNTITIGASWKWMSFDYIDILGVQERAMGELTTDLGNFANPGDNFSIHINASLPEGKTLEKIDLYMVGTDEPLQTFTSVSDTYTWLVPDAKGEYTFYARVYVDGEYTQSEDLVVTVTNLQKTRFEAEDAVLVGSGGVGKDKSCSGGKYMDVTDFETLTFEHIVAPEDGTYEIYVGYMCNYQAPKDQILLVNGKTVENMTFTSTTWDVYKTSVPLKQGENTIQIKASWKWMSFDYIDILGVTKGSSTTTSVQEVKGTASSLVAYCNSQSLVVVNYQTEAPVVSLEIIDMNGKRVAKTAMKDSNGSYICNEKLDCGVYAVKMIAGNEVIVKQVVVK